MASRQMSESAGAREAVWSPKRSSSASSAPAQVLAPPTPEPAGIRDALLRAMARTGDGFFVVDEQYRITLWNRAAASVLGLSEGDVLGRRCYEVLAGRTPSGQPLCRRPCRALQFIAAGAPPPRSQIVVEGRGGHQHRIETSHLPLPGGRVAHVFQSVRPTGLERFAEQIRVAVAGLEADRGAKTALADRPVAGCALTPRECHVLSLLAKGADTAAVTTQLVVSRSTARKHIQGVLHKLGAHSRLEAVAIATRLGLLA